ncbi:MAG: peptidoglycan-associated lipoprotein Pal [Pseudomonadota bacterium]
MKLLPALAIVAAFAMAACSDDTPPPVADTSNTPAAAPGGPAPNTIEYFNQVVGDRVFFATNQHTLSAQARGTLDRQARWLSANPNTNLTIEGHADERGTRQYNLALGARRANSVRRYLASQGVAANRLRAVTFGKERPAALCSNESCWSQNRRGVSIVAGAPSS